MKGKVVSRHFRDTPENLSHQINFEKGNLCSNLNFYNHIIEISKSKSKSIKIRANKRIINIYVDTNIRNPSKEAKKKERKRKTYCVHVFPLTPDPTMCSIHSTNLIFLQTSRRSTSKMNFNKHITGIFRSKSVNKK